MLTQGTSYQALPFCTSACLTTLVVAVTVLKHHAVAVFLLKGVVVAFIKFPTAPGALLQGGHDLGINKVAAARPLPITDSGVTTVDEKMTP